MVESSSSGGRLPHDLVMDAGGGSLAYLSPHSGYHGRSGRATQYRRSPSTCPELAGLALSTWFTTGYILRACCFQRAAEQRHAQHQHPTTTCYLIWLRTLATL